MEMESKPDITEKKESVPLGVDIKCEPYFVKTEPKDEYEAAPTPPVAVAPSVETMKFNIEIDIKPDHDELKPEPQDGNEVHGESVSADTSNSDDYLLKNNGGEHLVEFKSPSGGVPADDLKCKMKTENGKELTQKGGAVPSAVPKMDEQFKSSKKPSKSSSHEQVECNYCHKKLALKSILDHLRTHRGDKPLVCSICDTRFTSTRSLQWHVLTHKEKEYFECDYCQKRFPYKSKIILHIVSHTRERPFHCTSCKKTFGQKSALVVHMRNAHEENTCMCKLCQRVFLDKNELADHLKTHSGLKPYMCKICEKPFTRKYNFKVHLERHELENKRVMATPKAFTCKICHDPFPSKSSLQVHMRTHTGVMLYECHICEDKFPKYADLQKHLKKHTDEDEDVDH